VSNAATRIVVAIIAIPGILFLSRLGGYFWFAFCAAVFIGAAVEYVSLARLKGSNPNTVLFIVFGLGLMLVFLNERISSDLARLFGGSLSHPVQWQAFIWVSMLAVVVFPAVELFRRGDSPLRNLSATFFGVFYLGLCLGSTVGIREIFTVAEFPVGPVFGTAELDYLQQKSLHDWGGYTMMSILVTIWMCDTAAYFGGRAMGRHALFPRVSPKKTWEGAIWGVIAALLTMAAARYFFLDYLAPVHAIIIGLIIGTVGQVGDLVESLLKRDASVKDSSNILPGHGGIFDRFDSLIFLSPVLFLYFDFIVFA